MKLIFTQQIKIKGFFKLILSFRCVWPGMSKLPKITSFLFLCNMLRKKWVMKLIFCMQIEWKLPTNWYCDFDGMVKDSQSSQNSKLAMSSYNISKKKLEMKFIFYMQINIKVSYKVILSLLMGIIKHFQSTQRNKFVISLQYLQKEVMNGVHF